MPELSSITLKKKLYNTRIQNERQDLQQIVSGATKDINDITKLLLSLSKYRAETMGSLAGLVGNQKDYVKQQQMQEQVVQGASQEGVLGQQPSNISSVAELMLHDTNTNVYEDRQVNLF